MKIYFKFVDSLCTSSLIFYLFFSSLYKNNKKSNTMHFDLYDRDDGITKLLFLWLSNRKFNYNKDIDSNYLITRILYFTGFFLIMNNKISDKKY